MRCRRSCLECLRRAAPMATSCAIQSAVFASRSTSQSHDQSAVDFFAGGDMRPGVLLSRPRPQGAQSDLAFADTAPEVADCCLRTVGNCVLAGYGCCNCCYLFCYCRRRRRHHHHHHHTITATAARRGAPFDLGAFWPSRRRCARGATTALAPGSKTKLCFQFVAGRCPHPSSRRTLRSVPGSQGGVARAGFAVRAGQAPWTDMRPRGW